MLIDVIGDDARRQMQEAALVVRERGLGLRRTMIRFALPQLRRFIQLAEESGATGTDKKAAVMALAAEFYDSVIEPIDLPGPDGVLDPIGRVAFLAMCAWLVDWLAEDLYPASPL